MADVGHLVGFGLGLLVVTCLTLTLTRLAGVGIGVFPLWALARAAAQLTVIALLLRGILSVPWTVAGFLLLMVTTASLTAMSRIKELWRGRTSAVVGVIAGAVVALTAVFSLQLVDFQVRYLVATAGIVIGNAMTGATLAGRNFLRSSRQRASEIEAYLALGATPSQAHLDIGREAVRESLIPNLDQTKSTGLVTLPGAFVGALFGGASPQVAAEFQLVVLSAVLLAMTVTSLVVTRMAGLSPYLPVVEVKP